jgi:class 3 adenylate cyclase
MTQAHAQRQAAILFADIAGSTKLYETLGDVEALATIARALEVIRQICEEHGGRIVKTIGDEAMAIFPNAANAAYSAISMQTQVSAMKTSRGASLSIHAGFHYRPVIDDGKDVFGDSVNLAARLTSLAASGPVALRLRCRRPRCRYARARAAGHATVRGWEDIAVFELIWRNRARAIAMRRADRARRDGSSADHKLSEASRTSTCSRSAATRRATS